MPVRVREIAARINVMADADRTERRPHRRRVHARVEVTQPQEAEGADQRHQTARDQQQARR
jgi:vancomycin permeability regulator SanA